MSIPLSISMASMDEGIHDETLEKANDVVSKCGSLADEAVEVDFDERDEEIAGCIDVS